MRALAVLSFALLLAPFAAADLVELGSENYAGHGTGIAAIAAGEGYFPVVQTIRTPARGHVRIATLRPSTLWQTRLGGRSVGATRFGDAAVLANLHQGKIGLYAVRFENRRIEGRRLADIDVRGLAEPRVLRFLETPRGPLAVVAHAAGVLVSGAGVHADVALKGKALAATGFFRAGRGGVLAMFVADDSGTLTEARQTGAGLRVVRRVKCAPSGLRLAAMEATDRRLFLAGEREGRAVVHVFATDRGGEVWTRATELDLGAGRIAKTVLLDRRTLAAAGAVDGRSWVGVIDLLHGEPRAGHVRFLRGTGVTSLGANPNRVGWSLAATTDARSFHVLRLPGDQPRGRDWDPFPPERIPEPAPPPGEIPVPEPVPEPEPVPVPVPEEAGGYAVFPRVEVDGRRGVDTELVLLNLGERPRRLTAAYHDATGRLVHEQKLLLGLGRRLTVRAAAELVRRGVRAFDGYVVVTGVDKRDIVAEGVIRRGAAAEALRAHWR